MNSLFPRILFPVDFSERCVAAAPFIALMARQFCGELTLFHAVGDFHDFSTSDPPSLESWRVRLREAAESKLHAFESASFGSTTATRVVREGAPADAVVQYAMQEKIDLIAMPTHGHGVFRRVLLGSVTSRILHDSACPVWTCRHEEAQAPGWHTAIQNVLCAVDFRSENIHVLHTAAKVAEACGASLRIVHAVVIPGAAQATSLASAFGDTLQESAHRQIDLLQEKAGTDCKVSIDLGPVATVIRRAAEASGADLVVIGRGGLQGPLGRLRSNVSGIIHQCPCAVLSV